MQAIAHRARGLPQSQLALRCPASVKEGVPGFRLDWRTVVLASMHRWMAPDEAAPQTTVGRTGGRRMGGRGRRGMLVAAEAAVAWQPPCLRAAALSWGWRPPACC